MDSSTTAIVAGAGAAILASALTGRTTSRATRDTLEHNSSALVTQLTGEREAAREDREQDRLEQAYVSLLKYVFPLPCGISFIPRDPVRDLPWSQESREV